MPLEVLAGPAYIGEFGYCAAIPRVIEPDKLKTRVAVKTFEESIRGLNPVSVKFTKLILELEWEKRKKTAYSISRYGCYYMKSFICGFTSIHIDAMYGMCPAVGNTQNKIYMLRVSVALSSPAQSKSGSITPVRSRIGR